MGSIRIYMTLLEAITVVVVVVVVFVVVNVVVVFLIVVAVHKGLVVVDKSLSDTH